MPTPDTNLRDFSAVVVTGGSSGIGKSFIRLLSDIGPNLIFCNLSRRSPEIINEKLKLRHIPCDLSDSSQVSKAVTEVREILAREAPSGRILLINNSGYGVYGRFSDSGAEEQLGMVDVNIRGLVHLTAALLPDLRARGGAVVNVASVAAFLPTPFLSTYSATKAFVLHWSLALGTELSGSGVHVVTLCPGPTATDFFQRAGVDEGSVPAVLSQTSEQVVRAALRAVAAGRPFVVPGWSNKFLTLLVRVIPKALMSTLSGYSMAAYRKKRPQA